jgi:myosin heavy subunit
MVHYNTYLNAAACRCIQEFVSRIKLMQRCHDRPSTGTCDKRHTDISFSVHHFAGSVLYGAEEFVQRNTDNFPELLISVVVTSTNEFLAEELGELLKEGCRSSKTKEGVPKTVMDVFQSQLKQLMMSFGDYSPRYIRCIKPCDGLDKRKKLDHHAVLRQINCAGLVTAIEQSKEFYSEKLSYETIATRYACLLPPKTQKSIESMDRVDKVQVILSTSYAPFIGSYHGSTFSMPFTCGCRRVFFRTGALKLLETKRQLLCSSSAKKIQKVVRDYLSLRRILKIWRGFTILQSLYRGRRILHNYEIFRESSIKVQSCVRQHIHRSKFDRSKTSIVTIQRWWIQERIDLKKRRIAFRNKQRSALILSTWLHEIVLKRKIQSENYFAARLSSWLRSRNQRASFIRSRLAARTIAAWMRGMLAVRHLNRLKRSVNTIVHGRRLLLIARVKKHEDAKAWKLLQQKHFAAIKLQSIIRKKYRNQSLAFVQFESDPRSSKTIRAAFSCAGGVTRDENVLESKFPKTASEIPSN